MWTALSSALLALWLFPPAVLPLHSSPSSPTGQVLSLLLPEEAPDSRLTDTELDSLLLAETATREEPRQEHNDASGEAQQLTSGASKSGNNDGTTTAATTATEGLPQQRTAAPTNETGTDERCRPKLDLVFLLDTSGSIEQLYQEHVRWAVSLVESLPLEQDTVRVAAVQYAGFPLTEFALGQYPSAEDIRQHLQRVNLRSGVTRTGYALRKAEAELFRADRGARTDAAKVVVLFTDGLSIDDPLKPAQQMRDLKHVKIFVVSVSNDAFHAELNRIAGREENLFGPNDLARLRAALLTETERAHACTRIGDQVPLNGPLGGRALLNAVVDDPVVEALSSAVEDVSSAESQNGTAAGGGGGNGTRGSEEEAEAMEQIGELVGPEQGRGENNGRKKSVDEEEEEESGEEEERRRRKEEEAELERREAAEEEAERHRVQQHIALVHGGVRTKAVDRPKLIQLPAPTTLPSSTTTTTTAAVTATTATESSTTKEGGEAQSTAAAAILGTTVGEKLTAEEEQDAEEEAQNVLLPNDELFAPISPERAGAQPLPPADLPSADVHPNAEGDEPSREEALEPEDGGELLQSVGQEEDPAAAEGVEEPVPVDLVGSVGSGAGRGEEEEHAQDEWQLRNGTREAIDRVVAAQAARAAEGTEQTATAAPGAEERNSAEAQATTATAASSAERDVFEMPEGALPRRPPPLHLSQPQYWRPPPPPVVPPVQLPRTFPVRVELPQAARRALLARTSPAPTASTTAARKRPKGALSERTTAATTRRRETATLTATGIQRQRLLTAARTSTVRPTTTPQRTTASQTTTRAQRRALAAPAVAPVSSPRCSAPPVDLLFLVDSSGSVLRAYQAQKEWLQDILAQVRLDQRERSHRVALVQFAGEQLQKTEWDWDRYRDSAQMMDAFEQVRHLTGTTYIGRALEQALRVLDTRRRQVPALLVLLSDGFSQDDALQHAQSLRRLPNLQLFALSVSELSNTEYLRSLVGDPSHVFVGPQAGEQLRAQLLRRIRCS